jgi:hypothetical protein
MVHIMVRGHPCGLIRPMVAISWELEDL